VSLGASVALCVIATGAESTEEAAGEEEEVEGETTAAAAS
jgi:hypothetical protein